MAYTKEAFLAAGGYPEWLDFCEDLVFDFRLRAVSGGFVFAPQALVYFRPRGSWRAFWKQYYQYARGDGKAGLWPRRHLIRYLTYFAALPLIGLAGLLLSPWWWWLGLAGLAYMTYTPYRRLAGKLSGYNLAARLYAIACVPAIRVWGDWAKMAGYPAGVSWRLRHKPPAWRPEADRLRPDTTDP